MWIRIDPLASEPLFAQLVFQVKTAVARGELTEGAQLPSVRELAKELSINPNTVSKAYRELEGEGVIVRRQGSGCFVKGDPHALAEAERERRLGDLCRRLVIDAFHLGAGADQVRSALERALGDMQTPGAESAPENGEDPR